jgi:hypothetical protein
VAIFINSEKSEKVIGTCGKLKIMTFLLHKVAQLGKNYRFLDDLVVLLVNIMKINVV